MNLALTLIKIAGNPPTKNLRMVSEDSMNTYRTNANAWGGDPRQQQAERLVGNEVERRQRKTDDYNEKQRQLSETEAETKQKLE